MKLDDKHYDLARNSSTSVSTLEVLSFCTELLIRYYVSHNPNTPKELKAAIISMIFLRSVPDK
jgi:hypothetical protein